MKLPKAEEAVVEKAKILGYLLNAAHPNGGSKARFFKQFGFSAGAWQELAAALRAQACEYPVARVNETPFGPRYEIDGGLAAPDGRRPRVRTVWQFDDGQIAPRLITAYPIPVSI